jgi:hypothetical protein
MRCKDHPYSKYFISVFILFISISCKPVFNTSIPTLSLQISPSNSPLIEKSRQKEIISTQSSSLIDIDSFPNCKNIRMPKGKLLFSQLYNGIYSISIGCNGDNCDYQTKKLFSYKGFISDATWSPFGKFVIFAANIGSPSLPPNTGGMVSEMRLFSIPSQGGMSTLISSPGGFVSKINSCKKVDRILYERNQGYETKIYMVDSLGNGSSFSHNGESVFNPSCSSSGNDIAFKTIDDSLFIKHIGNSEHAFVSNNVELPAIWSPDDTLLSFDYSDPEGHKGICFAKTNLGKTIPPIVLNPCPISEIGFGAGWSMDGNSVISSISKNDQSREYFISSTPIITKNDITLRQIGHYIFSSDNGHFGIIWAGDSFIIIFTNSKVVIANISEMCAEQTIILPGMVEYSDWLPIK